ncbi:MAG: exodeoxyribonuclease III, partial [Bacteriovoracaceae bacterium]|nr:exodeoxyribonuclease III [Bacteriovoracaceae bacterium]
LASWNVNGIRSCINKGYLDWILQESPDIISLQETKASPQQFPSALVENSDYQIFSVSAKKAGYSGVLVQTKEQPLLVKNKIDIKKFDDEGRTLICEYENFILINSYYPNGQRDHNRVPFKLEYSDAILELALKLIKEKKKEVVLCGDFNTAHHEIDLANPESNKKSTGFLPIERKWMDKLVKSGFIDVFREFNPNQKGHYTWWTYRNNCRERNIGWRLDYFFLRKPLLSKVKSCRIAPEVSGSDHCPVILEIDL